MVMTREKIEQVMAEQNPHALLADGFDEAFIGFARRCGEPTLAVYDIDLCVKVLMERDGMTEEDAWEYLEFNSIGAWVGKHTPVWLQKTKGE